MDPGQTITWYKPGTGLLVQGFKEKPADIYTFDAAFLQRSIKDRYGVQDK